MRKAVPKALQKVERRVELWVEWKVEQKVQQMNVLQWLLICLLITNQSKKSLNIRIFQKVKYLNCENLSSAR